MEALRYSLQEACTQPRMPRVVAAPRCLLFSTPWLATLPDVCAMNVAVTRAGMMEITATETRHSLWYISQHCGVLSTASRASLTSLVFQQLDTLLASVLSANNCLTLLVQLPQRVPPAAASLEQATTLLFAAAVWRQLEATTTVNEVRQQPQLLELCLPHAARVVVVYVSGCTAA